MKISGGVIDSGGEDPPPHLQQENDVDDGDADDDVEWRV